MNYFIANIEEITLNNADYRKVLFTTDHSQLVVMSLKPGEEVGMEKHDNNDQFIRIEKGNGKAIINNEENILKDGSAIVIPAKTYHNIINTSTTECLKLYTIYSPANEPPNLVQHIKPEIEGGAFYLRKFNKYNTKMRS